MNLTNMLRGPNVKFITDQRKDICHSMDKNI